MVSDVDATTWNFSPPAVGFTIIVIVGFAIFVTTAMSSAKFDLETRLLGPRSLGTCLKVGIAGQGVGDAREGMRKTHTELTLLIRNRAICSGRRCRYFCKNHISSRVSAALPWKLQATPS